MGPVSSVGIENYFTLLMALVMAFLGAQVVIQIGC